MDGFIILVALAFLATVFVLPIVAFVRSGRAARETEQLGARLRSLEDELIRLGPRTSNNSARSELPSSAGLPRMRPSPNRVRQLRARRLQYLNRQWFRPSQCHRRSF